MPKPRKPQDGFNLAFLDVMACGLGAVILIFILVDFKAFSPDPTEEKNKLEQELAASEKDKQKLQKSIDEINAKIALESAKQDEAEEARANSTDDQSKLLQDQATLLAVLADLENQKAAISKELEKSANVQVQGTGEQNYITGMKIEGKQIGLLIDKSASMMGDNLLDILGRLALGDGEKVSTRKWLRTKRIAQWMIARLPQDSKVTVVAFSETAKVLGNNAVNSARLKSSMQAIVKDLDSVVPDGGTNLQIGLRTLFSANPKITDVYLVTDGLPTLGDGLPLKCKSHISEQQSISSDCRRELFAATVTKAPQGVHYNTILLPLEGDPYAPSSYWDWSRITSGTFLSPTREWP